MGVTRVFITVLVPRENKPISFLVHIQNYSPSTVEWKIKGKIVPWNIPMETGTGKMDPWLKLPGAKPEN